MATKCNVGFWMGPRNRKRAFYKNEGNVNKIWTFINKNASVLVH